MAMNSDELINGLVADLKPVSPLRQSRGMGGALLALGFGVLGMVAFYGIRADIMAGQPDPMMLLGLGLFLVLALASSWAVVDMARPYVGLRREGWGWTALMAGVLPLGAFFLMVSAWMRGESSGFTLEGLNCIRFGALWGLMTGATLVLWLRRGAPSLPARAGLLTGVAAGASGIVAVTLFCGHNDLVHIGFWHGLAVVLSGILGRLVVPRLIAW